MIDPVHAIERWLVDAGLAGASEMELLHGFCDRCRTAGLPLARAMLIVDTLHPIHEGRAFRWRADDSELTPMVEYGPSTAGASAAAWQGSPFYHLVTTGGTELRRRIGGGHPDDFAILRDLRAERLTDYVVPPLCCGRIIWMDVIAREGE